MKIADLKVGQKVEVELALVEATLRQTRQKKNYLALKLSDGEDTIGGNWWDYGESTVPDTNLIYSVTALVNEYMGTKQLTLQSLTKAADQDISKYSCQYANSDLRKACWDDIMFMISNIKNKGLKALTTQIYNKYKDELMNSSSAASVHHVGIGGNIVHTLEVAQIATAAAQYANDMVNIDLVIAGALLHDIGKIHIYDVSGPIVDYTEDGYLAEHILFGCEMLNEADIALKRTYTNQAKLLKHIIASHHGRLEYGSPVLPCCAEAHLVNFADGVSATLDTLRQANAKAIREGRTLTDRIYTAGNVKHFTRPTVDQILSQEAQ